MGYEPVSRSPALGARDVGELRHRLNDLFSVWSMNLGRGEANRPLRDGSITGRCRMSG